MANLTTAADLVDKILFNVGEKTDGTSDFNAQVLIELNQAYQSVWNGGNELVPQVNEDWWWLKKDPPGTLTLEPVIDNSTTASVTNNSTSVTLSAAPTPNVTGWFFKTDDNADVFRVSSQAGTAVTLDSVYTSDTDTAANYRLFKMEYTLASDVMRLQSPMRVYQNSRIRIEGMSLEALENQWPLGEVHTGVPRAFAVVSQSRSSGISGMLLASSVRSDGSC